MNAVSEEMISDDLDGIAQVARQSEEDAVLQKEDPASMLQPPHEKYRQFDMWSFKDSSEANTQGCIIEN